MREYSKTELEQLQASGRDWQRNDILRAKWSARFAWVLVVVLALATAAAAFALAMLAPLKKVEPYVIQVDRSTGETHILRAMSGSNPIKYDESLKRHLIAQYVTDREGWVPLAENEMIHAVNVMSTQEEATRFNNWMSIANPNGPLKRFADVPFVKIEIRSISFISANVAKVRYTQTVYQHTAGAEVGRYIATMTFDITSKPPLEADLEINPVGFQVSNYQTSPEN